uniref:Uncharacterized protein n=1 Tax=Trypanosoma vivax (strain Y486) TaxID=1055687 RepID=G0TRL1_TRYVY|nr:conserved hypothetical protein, in T. vivax [Trypanosoma vivax Y486]
MFKDSGEVCVVGGAWEREPHCISQGEPRAVSLALSSFAETMVEKLHICIGDTTAMSIMNKGVVYSDALAREPSLIDKALKEQGVRASWDYIASTENAADGISRGNMLGKVDVARGLYMRRSAEGEVINPFPLFPFTGYIRTGVIFGFNEILLILCNFLRCTHNCQIIFFHRAVQYTLLAIESWVRCCLSYFILFFCSLFSCNSSLHVRIYIFML